MNALRRTATILLTVLCLTALAPDLALAQPKKNNKEPTAEEQKGYTLPYFFVMIGVLAAVVAVCRPPGRKWDIEQNDDEAEA